MTALNSKILFFRKREPPKVNKWDCGNTNLAEVLGDRIKTRRSQM